MYFFYDTETNGLPSVYNAPAEDTDNWPRVIQLAWSVYDAEQNLVSQNKHLIKPNGWQLPTVETFLSKGKSQEEAEKNASFWPTNGFTMELLETQGKEFINVLHQFIADRQACTFAIAHNQFFDSRVMRAEIIRLGQTVEFTQTKICTMMKSISFCNLPGKNGKGKKFPQLSELYKILFNSEFDAHDAGNDVDACAKCFFELVRLGIIEAK